MDINFEITNVYEKNEEYITDDNVRLIVNRGSTRSSKTYSILQLLIIQAIQNKDIVITIVGETLPKIKKSTLRDLKSIMGDMWKTYGEFNQTEMVYTFPNKSIIQFVSGDQESKFRGMKQDLLFVDECNFIKEEVFTQLAIRTIDKIIVAFNPSSEFYITDMVNEDDDTVEIVSTYKDNPFLELTIVNEIEKRANKDENFRRVFALGLYGSAEGLVFQEDLDWFLIDDLPVVFDKELWGMDFGFTDPTTYFQCRIVKNDIYVKEHIYEANLINRKLGPLMKDSNPHNIMCIADSEDPKSIKDLNLTYGINIKGIKKEQVLPSIDNLKKRNVFITTDSINVIKDFRNYHWSLKKKDKKGRAVPEHSFSHSIDTVRYVADTQFVVRNKKQIRVITI